MRLRGWTTLLFGVDTLQQAGLETFSVIVTRSWLLLTCELGRRGLVKSWGISTCERRPPILLLLSHLGYHFKFALCYNLRVGRLEVLFHACCTLIVSCRIIGGIVHHHDIVLMMMVSSHFIHCWAVIIIRRKLLGCLAKFKFKSLTCREF